MSIYRRIPGRKTNTLPKALCEDHPMKTTYRTDQTTLLFYLLTLRACADKATAVLFAAKGNQHGAVELQHNSVRVRIVPDCVDLLYLLKHNADT